MARTTHAHTCWRDASAEATACRALRTRSIPPADSSRSTIVIEHLPLAAAKTAREHCAPRPLMLT